jgi:hypothetical protein
VLIEARSTIHARHFASSLGRLTRAPQMESYPKFHNEVGVSCDIEVDVWVILRPFIPNALELAAANA